MVPLVYVILLGRYFQLGDEAKIHNCYALRARVTQSEDVPTVAGIPFQVAVSDFPLEPAEIPIPLGLVNVL